MTTSEILMSCVGFILCAFIFCTICIAIMVVVWHLFKTDIDVDIDIDIDSNWVKVSDRLPKEREQVLIRYWNGQIHIGAMINGKWHSNWNDYDIDLATHWMSVEFKEEEQ